MGLKEIQGEAIAAMSLFGPNDGLNPMRPIYRNNLIANQEILKTDNSPELLLRTFSSFLNQSNTNMQPYWSPNQKLDCHSLNAALIQFTNEHTGFIHNSARPPSEDVEKFINSILNSETQVGVVEQYKLASTISQKHILGALLISIWGSRIAARNRDSRIYPDVNLTTDMMRHWREQIIALPTYCDSTSIDVTGDNYYFWTHCLAGYVNDLLDNNVTDVIFDHGTKIMVKVRSLAGKPTMSDHYEATLFGRAIGKSMAYLVKYPDSGFGED